MGSNNSKSDVDKRKRAAIGYFEEIKKTLVPKQILELAKDCDDYDISSLPKLPFIKSEAVTVVLLVLGYFAARYNDQTLYHIDDAVKDVAKGLGIDLSTVQDKFTRGLDTGSKAEYFKQIQNAILFDDDPLNSELIQSILNKVAKDPKDGSDYPYVRKYLKEIMFIGRCGNPKRCENIINK